MQTRFVTMAAAAAATLFGLGVAEIAYADAKFTCRLAPDGKTLEALIANPYKQPTSCQVNCQAATGHAGTSFQTSCTREIAPSGGAVVLCSKTYDKGRLSKVIGGSGDCIKPLAAGEGGDKDDEVDVQKLIGNPAAARNNVRDQVPAEARKMFDDMNKEMSKP